MESEQAVVMDKPSSLMQIPCTQVTVKYKCGGIVLKGLSSYCRIV